MGSLHFYTLFPPCFYSKNPALYPVLGGGELPRTVVNGLEGDSVGVGGTRHSIGERKDGWLGGENSDW
jgi:hypothetical protein